MSQPRISCSLFLILSSCWLFGTILIDFFIVPGVFQVVVDFFNAGELGIRVFSIFNNIEVIFGTLLVIVGLRTKRLPLVILSITVLLISLSYLGFLTPKITELTALWKASGDVIAHGRDYQQEHQHFHNIYIGLDSLKLILLTSLLVLGLWKQEWFE